MIRFYAALSLLIFVTTSVVLSQGKKPGRKPRLITKECSDSLKSESFTGCHFEHSNFEGRQFDKFENFDNSVFEEYANFEEMDALKGISFRHDVFKGDFSLYRMETLTTDFDSSIFKGEARFERFSFSKFVNFSNCTFENEVSFKDVGFETADFSHLHLTENTDFAFHNTGARKLDFSFNPKIYNEIRLIDAFDSDPPLSQNDTIKSPNPCLINLYKSDISKFYIDYINFKLYFPDYYDPSGNDTTHITSYEKQIIYEGLLNNFKNHDQLDSYKLLDIEYQKFKYDNQGLWFYKWLDHYWWNFGYNKEYVFRWTLGLLAFFTIVNYFFLEALNKKIYLIKGMPNSLDRFKKIRSVKLLWDNFKILWARFWFALVYTSAIFFMVTLNIENFKFGHRLGTFYLIFIYCTGLICLAYIANFVLHK